MRTGRFGEWRSSGAASAPGVATVLAGSAFAGEDGPDPRTRNSGERRP